MRSIIGIDLGTTFSVVAKIDEHGKPVIVHGSDGENITPSCVFVDPDSGAVEAGASARRELYSGEADNAVGRFKREMGNSKTTYTLGGKKYTPTDLSALLLEQLVRDRTEQIGEIEDVVVTVPANFANEAREATIEAAQRAGLNVKYIINEPTAAALCYSFKEGMNLEGTYAIYDMGGGTFDISIIKIKDGDVEVLTSNGIHKLGGTDFDEMLQDLVEEKYLSVTGEAAEDGDYDRQRAEEDKKELSGRESVGIRINRKGIKAARKEFEELISSKITQAELLCESTLDEAGLKPEDIKGVLCAGGSTRIPMVKESIKRVFNQEPIFKANVDEVVALGAALYAAYKGDSKNLSTAQKQAMAGMNVTERTTMCYGTIVISDDEEQELNSIIIKRNTVIPCEKTKPYYTASDGQINVRCDVTESKNEERDPRFVTVVATKNLPLPPDRPAGRKLKITYGFTDNQTMRGVFEDVESGETAEITHRIEPPTEPDIDNFTVE